MENTSTKLRQKTGTRKRRGEGSVVFSKAIQKSLPDAGPCSRDLKEGECKPRISLWKGVSGRGNGRDTPAERGLLCTVQRIAKRPAWLQRKRGRWAAASNGMGTAQRLGDFLQTFAAFTLSEMRSHWGL